MGDSVPEVIMTLPNRLKRGAMASDESKQDSCMHGSEAPGMEEPLGSIMIANLATPSEYVASKVAKSAISEMELKSSKLLTCRVRNKEFKREYANRRGFASSEVPLVIRCKKAKGVSLWTPPLGPATDRSRVFKCSTTFFMN
jgi:hypothetical protein